MFMFLLLNVTLLPVLLLFIVNPCHGGRIIHTCGLAPNTGIPTAEPRTAAPGSWVGLLAIAPLGVQGNRRFGAGFPQNPPHQPGCTGKTPRG